MPCSEFSFPFQRRRYDFGEIVVPRLPAERGTNTGGASDQRGWIAGAPGFLFCGYWVSGDVLDHGEQLANAIAPAVAAVQCRGFAAAAQVGQGLQMGVGQVLDVDVVAHAGAVGRGVVGAEDRHVGALTDRDLAGHFGQQGRLRCRLADSAARVRARDVEVAQRHVAQGVDGGDVAQHPLRHEFRGAVRIDRRRRRVFGGFAVAWNAIDGGRRGEHHVLDARAQRVLEQRSAGAGVVAVVFQRVGDGLGHDGVRREVHDGVDVEAREQLRQHGRVAGVADHELAVQHRLAEARRQVVEHDDVLAGLAELANDVRADVAGSPGDQNCFVRHRLKWAT